MKNVLRADDRVVHTPARAWLPTKTTTGWLFLRSMHKCYVYPPENVSRKIRAVLYLKKQELMEVKLSHTFVMSEDELTEKTNRLMNR